MEDLEIHDVSNTSQVMENFKNLSWFGQSIIIVIVLIAKRSRIPNDNGSMKSGQSVDSGSRELTNQHLRLWGFLFHAGSRRTDLAAIRNGVMESIQSVLSEKAMLMISKHHLTKRVELAGDIGKMFPNARR